MVNSKFLYKYFLIYVALKIELSSVWLFAWGSYEEWSL